MTDLPIIFSAPMVLALLAGRKMMTRRLAHRQVLDKMAGRMIDVPTPWQRVKPGDRLWVRENLWINGGYSATDKPNIAHEGKRPAIHMPRTRSRLTLVVTATKIERLDKITRADVIDEGAPVVETSGGPEDLMVEISAGYYESPRLWFHRLWDSLHGAGSWDENPEVVALTFTVHQQNIDSMEKAV